MSNQIEIRRLNIIAEFSGFFTLSTVTHLSAGAKLMYLSLLHTCNRAGWPLWVHIDRNRLCADMSVADVRAVNRARDELIDLGLITVKKGKKGHPSGYCLTQIEANNAFGDFVTPQKLQAKKQEAENKQTQADLVAAKITLGYGYHGLVQLTKGERLLVDSALGKELAEQTIHHMDTWLHQKGYDVIKGEHFDYLLQWGKSDNKNKYPVL